MSDLQTIKDMLQTRLNGQKARFDELKGKVEQGVGQAQQEAFKQKENLETLLTEATSKVDQLKQVGEQATQEAKANAEQALNKVSQTIESLRSKISG